MKTVLLSLLILVSASASAIAQKPKKVLVESQEETIEYATRELDLAMEGPEGELFLLGQKLGVKGHFTYDLTVKDKGNIGSVFAVGNEGGDIKSQNKIKDYLVLEFKFKTFKTPKGNRYKFRYIFKYD